MKWVDYREKLGIGFSDSEKSQLLRMKIINIFNEIQYTFPYHKDSYLGFCNMTGHEYYSDSRPFSHVIDYLSRQLDLKEFLSIYIAFVNTYVEANGSDYDNRNIFINILTEMMEEAKINFDIQKDEVKNEYFIFPKGAAELDDALVSEPLEWLTAYPIAHKTFVIALKQYSDGVYIRDTADNFRKSLEEFLKEFFNNNKNLSNNIKEVGKFLKENGADNDIVSLLVGLSNSYDKLNNKIAKHNDKVDARFLEFLMYQTGLFIRMLIVVKQSELKKAE